MVRTFGLQKPATSSKKEAGGPKDRPQVMTKSTEVGDWRARPSLRTDYRHRSGVGRSLVGGRPGRAVRLLGSRQSLPRLPWLLCGGTNPSGSSSWRSPKLGRIVAGTFFCPVPPQAIGGTGELSIPIRVAGFRSSLGLRASPKREGRPEGRPFGKGQTVAAATHARRYVPDYSCRSGLAAPPIKGDGGISGRGLPSVSVEIRVQGIHPDNHEDVEKVWIVDVEFADGHHEQTMVARLRDGGDAPVARNQQLPRRRTGSPTPDHDFTGRPLCAHSRRGPVDGSSGF